MRHFLGFLFAILQATTALPTAFGNGELLNAKEAFNERAGSFTLRILPLGGSITLGWGSSTGNGYRKPLRDALRKDGWIVNMVGTKSGGTNAPVTGVAMIDNSVEAAAGYVVTQVQDLLNSSLQFLPNVVLVNAGVNDCTFDVDIANIGSRMGSLLDEIFNNIPGTTVILSTLMPSLDPTAASCHDSVNAQYRDLVSTRASHGQKVQLAEFAPKSAYWHEVIGQDYYDSTHPTDAGHAKLAAIWHQSINNAYRRGWLTAPASGNFPNPSGDDADTFTSPGLPPVPESSHVARYLCSSALHQSRGPPFCFYLLPGLTA